MPELRLDVVDAAELAELLQFLAGWLARDPDRLGASLEAFVGHPAYGTAQLRQDLNRLSSCSAAKTASPCSATARQSEAMTMTSPLRGPERPRRNGKLQT